MMQVIKQFDYSWFADYEKWCAKNPKTIPIPCPDGKEGCAVFHTRKDPRKPTYDGFKEWLKSLPKEDKPITTTVFGVCRPLVGDPIDEKAKLNRDKMIEHLGELLKKKITKTYEYDQDGRVIKEIITEE